MNGQEKNMGVAIIICDKVITEVGTGNKTLVSSFNSIMAKGFPCAHPKMSVYVALSNSTGVKDINLRLTLESKTVFKMGGKLTFPNPNSVAEMIFNINGLPLAEPGVYCFEVHAGDDYIFESRFNVEKME